MQRSYLSTRSNTWGLATPTPRRVAQIASGIVIAIACCVLIGWQLNLQSIESLLPGLATMKANTAICFVWAGISLLLQTGKRQDNRTVKIANLCAVALNITALLTLCQYVFGWNFGIDELLFTDRDSPATLARGRMGINTAVSFCLLGTALWLMSKSHSPSVSKSPTSGIDSIAIAQGLTIGTIAIAIQAIVGYAYNVSVLYQFTSLTTSMALHTAICFAILGGGILVLTGDRGLMQVVTGNLIGSKVARRLLPTAVGLPLVLGWLILLGLGANWYDPNFALSLMAMSMAASWVGLIRQNAGKLNQMDNDRIRSDDRIRSSTERLRLALLGAKQGIWELDVQTQVLTWDDRCKELFGLLPDALVTYSKHFEAIHPEDRQRVADGVELAIRDCGEFAIEYRTIYPDGPIHWVLAQGSYYGSATAERMLGTMMDITVRKQAQLNDRFLQQLTRRLRQFTDPDEMQWETAQSLGEYLDVDRVTWCKVDWQRRLTTIERDWYRDGLDSHAGVYALSDFLPPELQVALFAGESVAIADVCAAPLIAPYLDTYEQLGMGAIAKVPCIFEERWVMTLNANTQQARVWRDDEITLMETIVAQIWPLVEQTRSDRALRVAAEQMRADRVIIGQQLGEIESIYRSAPIGLCFVDTDLRYVRINEQLAQINGASVEAHIGNTVRELLPDLADDIEPIYRQVIETGEPIIELEISGTNPAQPGVWRCWLASFYPQIDAEHRVIGVNVAVQEITERQREAAERERSAAGLQESQQKFRAIFDQTFELLGIVSTDGVLLDVNQTALDSIAAQKSELVGKCFWDTPWWHTEQLQQQLRAAIVTAAGGKFMRYEVEFPNANGGVSITDFSLKPVFDEQGRVTMLVAEAHDITERVRVQVALEQRTQALDRAAAILHDRNRELDSFVYVVSHDLKAPLRAISNLSQWIEDDFVGVLSTQIQQHTLLLRNRIERMEAIIDGLLDYARIGRSDEQIEPVAIAALLAETIDSIAPPPTFKIVIAPDLPTLQTKRLFLSQVFTNLISNAIEHHDRIDGSIQISCQDCGDMYEFTVADDGPGIDPEHHDRVFEIFQTLNPQNRADSTGIGLAIVKKIIEAEGGRIRLQSQLGAGTTCSFSWPKQSPSALRVQKLHNVSFLD